jgi:hypothetical protein
MGDFLGERQCVTHHACDCIMARAKRAEQAEDERDALRQALTELVRLRKLKESNPAQYVEEDAVGAKASAWCAADEALAASVSKEETRDDA